MYKWSLRCQDNLDLYTTLNSTKGNKSLTYPIGLITVDEVGLAGGGKIENNKYYLYNGQQFHTLSPAYVKKVLNVENSFYINNFAVYSGALSTPHIHFKHGLRPVINLRKDIKVNGTGTISDPYLIS